VSNFVWGEVLTGSSARRQCQNCRLQDPWASQRSQSLPAWMPFHPRSLTPNQEGGVVRQRSLTLLRESGVVRPRSLTLLRESGLTRPRSLTPPRESGMTRPVMCRRTSPSPHLTTGKTSPTILTFNLGPQECGQTPTPMPLVAFLLKVGCSGISTKTEVRVHKCSALSHDASSDFSM
jgi:hypothetical protein